MTWSAPIWIYLWLAGMAGGAYFAAFLVTRISGETNRALLRLATYIGVPTAIVGVLLLVVDLGRPLDFWHLYTQLKLSSPMSIGTWILTAWLVLAVVMIVLWWFENRVSPTAAVSLRTISGSLGWVNLVMAVLLVAYTGVLLAVSSQSLWAGTALLPALFVASAVSTGVALIIVIAITANSIATSSLTRTKLALNQLFGTTHWKVPSKTVARLAEADAVLILVELAALIGYVIWLATSAMAGADEALRLITTGSLAAPFWAGVVVLALLIPLSLDYFGRSRPSSVKAAWRLVLTSSLCAILGGLVLRAVITIGGQI
jgi:formate-dependent nitrite reductase membrane component NrfD